jgi:hypothetical protein
VGANRIGSSTVESIRAAVAAGHSQDWLTSTPYGDGTAAAKIVNELLVSARN